MSIDSDHVNYLIYRYLIESGYQHSSFTFTQESGVMNSSVAGTKIPPGSLIAHLQRALNYVQAEVNLTDDGRPADLEDLDTIEALNLIESVQPEVCEERRQQLRARLRETNKLDGDARPGVAAATQKAAKVVKTTTATILKGHEREAFALMWNPKYDLVASGSSDATARVWDLSSASPSDTALVLRHVQRADERNGVTCLHWSHDGEFLATGAYDGLARIWTRTGELKHRLAGHGGPLFAVKWNASDKHLLSSSVDQTVIVWDVVNGKLQQKYALHNGPCVDVAWRDLNSFASCSTDKLIYVCEVGKKEALRSFDGHEDEVNYISWDRTGHYLASCSDDCTSRIWMMDRAECLHTLRHDNKISSLAWSNGTESGLPLLLASASYDNTTKVWDAKKGTCVYTLVGHNMPVYSVEFSHDGHYLASGSYDHMLLVWSMETGSLVQSYQSQSGIFDVGWNESDTSVATCHVDSTLAVVKFQPS